MLNRPNRFPTGITLSILATISLAISTLFLSLFWINGSELGSEWRGLAPLLILFAFSTLLMRGASDLSPAFWILVLAAYPLCVPLIGLDLVGMPAFASGSRANQDVNSIMVPILIAACATCLLALNLSVSRICVPTFSFARLQGRVVSGSTAVTAFLAGCVALLAANQVDAPLDTLQLGRVSYKDLKANRDDALNFASGLVLVFGAASTLFLAVLLVSDDLTKRLKCRCAFAFGLIVLVTVSWQLMAASRVEAVGLLLIQYLCFGDRLHPSLRFIGVVIVVFVLALIGYVRTLAGALAYLSRDFIAWPGGVENVIFTYTETLSAIRHGELDLQLGDTYLALLLRLPPQFFEFDRPPRAYDLIAEQTRLIGGEYYLSEPFMNFTGLGVLLCCTGLTFCYNWATRQLRALYAGVTNFFQALISLVLFTVCFRTIWYGLEHTIKVLMLAGIIALPLLAIQFAWRNSAACTRSAASRLLRRA